METSRNSLTPRLKGHEEHRASLSLSAIQSRLPHCVQKRCSVADIVLVIGAEVQTTRNAKEGADFLARASHYETERGLDPFTFPAMFARRTKAYCERHGVTPEALAPIVAKAYANANRNPNAHMREVQMSAEQAAQASDKNPCFLDNEELHSWLRVGDCSQVSDGGCAIILCSDAGLEKLGETVGDPVAADFV